MEYLLLLIEYHKVKKWKSIKPFLFSLVLGFCIFFICDDEKYIGFTASYHESLLTVLEILVGFSIAVFTIVLSIDNDNVKDAKTTILQVNFYSKPLSLWDSMLIELAYTVIIQGLLLIANLIYPLFVDLFSEMGKIFFSVNIALINYCILILLRGILSLYFVLTRK